MHTAHVPAGEGPYPTILALHGWGANAHDLLGLAPLLHGGEALVLCPQGPVAFQIGQGMLGFGWFPLPEGGGRPDPAEYAKGLSAIATFLDAAVERYPVERRKLVLLGFSQGGVLAYDLALRDPSRFAGLIALSSWLPAELAQGIPRVPEGESLPVLVMHGTEDPLIPIAMAHQSRDALIALGVSPTFREYSMGHEIRPEALRDLIGWLDQKVLRPIQLV
jgi:phospholipase/carboxylesterase